MKLKYKDNNDITKKSSDKVAALFSSSSLWPLFLLPKHTSAADMKVTYPNYRFMQILAEHYNRRLPNFETFNPDTGIRHSTMAPYVFELSFGDQSRFNYSEFRDYMTNNLLMPGGYISGRHSVPTLKIQTLILNVNLMEEKTIPVLLADLIKNSRSLTPFKDDVRKYVCLNQLINLPGMIDDTQVGVFFWKEHNFMLIIERPHTNVSNANRDIGNYSTHGNAKRVLLWLAIQVLILQMVPRITTDELRLATELNTEYRKWFTQGASVDREDLNRILTEITGLYYVQEKVDPIQEYYKQFRQARIERYQSDYDQRKNSADNYYSSFMTAFRDQKEAEMRLQNILNSADTPPANTENLLIALETLPQIVDIRPQGDRLAIDIEAPVTYDYAMLRFLQGKPELKAIIEGLEAGEITMNFHQSFLVNQDVFERGSLDGLSITRYREGMSNATNKGLNPHLSGASCFGDHRPDMIKALKSNNILGFLLILIQSTSQINLNDGAITRYFNERLDQYTVLPTTPNATLRSALLYAREKLK